MGMNATAILFRGVIFPEEYTFPWTERLAAAIGLEED